MNKYISEAIDGFNTALADLKSTPRKTRTSI